MRCQLDPKVNPSTILNYRTEIGEMWGSACGRNRGVFVLDPPDGNTYGTVRGRNTFFKSPIDRPSALVSLPA
jgi:hypothetical protein